MLQHSTPKLFTGSPALNILFVTQNYPYPGVPHGGGQDFWRLIAFLRQRNRIYVATFDDPVAPVSSAALEPYVSDLHIIRYHRTRTQKMFGVLRSVLHGHLDWRIGRRQTEMQRLVRRWCEQYAIDVLHCGWTEMGEFLWASERHMLRVFDDVDIRFLADEYAVAKGRLSPRLAQRRKALELRYCAHADLVITRSEADLNILRQHLPGLNGFVLPPAGNVEQLLTIQRAEAKPYEIMFCGAMNRPSNVEGITWFVKAVWPRIQAAIPQAQLKIVGAYPTKSVLAFNNLPGVSVAGFVPDLRDCYATARVIIAPIFVPGGSLNKVIDGLAAGRPVVGTSIANRGTQAECVYTVDSPEAFAAQVIRLLSDSSLWEQCAAASHAYAQTHFQWVSMAAELETCYQHALQTLTIHNSRAHA